jgi:hypothetical protein
MSQLRSLFVPRRRACLKVGQRKFIATGIISLCACLPCWGEARANVTVTESLISAEIVRLGATTESPSELKLIAFIGNLFTADHFEMMEHTPNVTFVSIINIPAPATAFDSIKHRKKLTNLEIQGGSFTGDGIGKLRRNSELRRVYISNCTLSDTNCKIHIPTVQASA